MSHLMSLSLYLFIFLITPTLKAQSVLGEYNCKVRHADEDLSGKGTTGDCNVILNKSNSKMIIELNCDIKYKDRYLQSQDKHFRYIKNDWWKGIVLKSINNSHEANIVPYTMRGANGMDISLNFFSSLKWYSQKALELTCLQTKIIESEEIDFKM